MKRKFTSLLAKELFLSFPMRDRLGHQASCPMGHSVGHLVECPMGERVSH